MYRGGRRHVGLVLSTLVLQAALAVSPAAAQRGTFTKQLGFAILEDYDKGAPLADVGRDFARFRELGIRTWRGSFGWDDYEPARGRYDFAWLHRFVRLARQQGIALRPYLAYTPEWAAAGRRADGQVWNDPPRRLADWIRFVAAIAGALRRYPNVLSYEIYNEEDTKLWWDGTAAEYDSVLAAGTRALRRAAPRVQVILGGMVWPDADWLESACGATRVDVVPFHGYPETWSTEDTLTVENYVDRYRRGFVAALAGCGAPPVWINEAGFATSPGRSERAQASWWVRAVATWAADPLVSQIGVYEIKDAPPGAAVIGDAPNLYLGLLRHDGTPKLAFHTVRRLVSLFQGRLVVEDSLLRVEVTEGRAGRLYHHLVRRPDGRRVLVVWDRAAAPTVRVVLPGRGRHAMRYSLDGRATPADLRGMVLDGLRLTPDEPLLLVVDP